ncbi:uncharacterized protein LOC132182235 [Corylus avellana]|uniref:uncharacterized protein LOC132182235 n=1 Tax=Corylus avellana TaxID=13451 RepID=UPI00286C82C4|nr:uncharacterized protein LOC132182235 [Corylus avellana]
MVLSFSEEDAKGIMLPHDDALVVTVTVANHVLHRILVDNGSSADILYWSVFKQIGIDRSRIKPFGSPLVGFAREQVQPIGIISLPVTAGIALRQSTIMVDFLVVDRPSTCNIISQPTLNKLKAVTSTYHLKMKFSIEEGVGEVKGSRKEGEPKGEPAELLEDVTIANGKVVKIGSQLSSEVREGLVTFLKENQEVFAWTHEDTPGISPKDVLHQLNVDSSMKLVKQKRRKFAPERNMAIAEEVEKLLRARFIEEVHYSDRLANVVLVKKSNGKWKMSVNFTDLNKACLKDSFPLPLIDALVDSTPGYGLLSFMDAFSGYNQICMHPEYKEKTTFITN